MERDGVMLSLDETTAEFSLVAFPEAVVGMTDELSTFRIVGGEDGAVRVVRVIDTDLVVFTKLKGNGEWVAAYPYELPWPPALQACRAADYRRPRR
jgi:hypothetical protein